MLDDTLIADLRAVRRVVVFTGAGMSAESGIPTFRDRSTGLWAQVDPMEIATPWAFRADPQRTWDWHVHLAEAVRAARPNAGHAAIAALERAGLEVTVITQNIDALHHRAGSREVIELHGNLLRLKSFVDEDATFAAEPPPVICAVCDGYAAWDACDPYADRTDLAAIELCAGPVPRCPGCGALLRPDVVWFGEALAAEAIEAAWDAVDRCEALIAVGASLEVEPAASLPWHALRRGARVIEVNLAPTALAGQCHAAIRGAAAEVLPDLFATIWSLR
ncbi:MAG: Sir2 family NAD-dependent protein deacetylase [Sulfuritalea sp.]|jgi:NAD-dependent deacetylase|nr:Sir2 family NAD-dependent protein deacetylase [Sulfuritalea sp.]MDP1984492.1 Sir2 family NAD-dependent protein deacetylase [Sulfuritalea sp.]